MNNIWFMILLQVLLIALNAVFACAEIAVISISDAKLERLEEEGNKRAKKLRKLTSQPAKFLATIQVAITLSGFLGSAFAAENFSGLLVNWLIGLGIDAQYTELLDTVSVIVITLVLSFFTLVLGELVPKRVAMKKAEKLGLGMASMIYFISKLFAPIVFLLTASTNGVLRLMRIDPNESEEEVSEEDIKIMVDAGSKKGTIDSEDKELIENIFEFDDLTAGEVATHRTDLSVLWLEDSDKEWEDTIKNGRFTRYPICSESIDKIKGVLNVRDYLMLEDKSREAVMAEAVKPAYFVPQSVKADVLFKNMKEEKEPLAIVLDEYGGTLGVVTVNDLVEQLIGDFSTDEDTEEELPDITLIGTGDAPAWRIRGSAMIADVEDVLNISLPSEDCDTFGGYIFCQLGLIPDDGSKFTVESDGLIIDVTEVDDHQIISADVRFAPKSDEDEDEE